MRSTIKYFLVGLGLCLLLFGHATAQTKEERLANAESQISTALLSYGNHTAELDSGVTIIDVDSSIGDAGITDPYGTLKGCFLFAAYDSAETGGGETVGVFKNGSIVWLSGNFLIEDDEMVGARFWGTLDLNNDNSVEVILTGGHGILGGRAVHEYMWIFSWNGFNGVRINAVDKYGKSIIEGEGIDDSFSLYNTHQKGIKAIGSGIAEELSNPAGAVGIKRGKTYCWNGKLYVECRNKR